MAWWVLYRATTVRHNTFVWTHVPSTSSGRDWSSEIDIILLYNINLAQVNFSYASSPRVFDSKEVSSSRDDSIQ